MNFDFEEYKSASLTFPLAMVTFFSLLLLVVVLLFVSGYKKGEWTIIQKIAIFTIPLIMIIPSGLHLRYGIHLFFEGPENSVVMEGTIESIESLIHSPRYYYEGKAVRAEIIIINDQEFYFMTSGDLSVGDYVEIKYLPRSTFVLECDLKDEWMIFLLYN